MLYRIVCDYGYGDCFYIDRAVNEEDARIKVSILRRAEDVLDLRECMDRACIYYMEEDI